MKFSRKLLIGFFMMTVLSISKVLTMETGSRRLWHTDPGLKSLECVLCNIPVFFSKDTDAVTMYEYFGRQIGYLDDAYLDTALKFSKRKIKTYRISRMYNRSYSYMIKNQGNNIEKRRAAKCLSHQELHEKKCGLSKESNRAKREIDRIGKILWYYSLLVDFITSELSLRSRFDSDDTTLK